MEVTMSFKKIERGFNDPSKEIDYLKKSDIRILWALK
jgi:hypothetical protein